MNAYTIRHIETLTVNHHNLCTELAFTLYVWYEIGSFEIDADNGSLFIHLANVY